MTEILSTRPLNEELIESATQKEVNVHIIPFIKTEPVDSVEIQQEVEHAALLNTHIVFTSMNAVEAVHDILHDQETSWEIWCIGHSTKELVEVYFGEQQVAGYADDASELADRIIEEGSVDEVIFFCGDMKRPELPEKLKAANISFDEIIVYETVFTPRHVVKHYDGILFFSPSAVESFFSLNELPGHTVLFAIGKSTAAAIRSRCANEVVIASQPAKEDLLREAISYLVA